MVGEETRLLQVREQAWIAQQRQSLLIALLGAAFLLALSIVAALIVRGDLRRREERARERARVYEYQDRLTSIVSHDVRNPLSAIQISITWLLRRREQFTPEQVGALERVMHSAGRIDALSALLIDYTRARLGRGLPTSMASTDARDAVERAVDELRSSNPGSAIALEVQTENSRGVWDAERIAQLASNLVSNAVRYGRPGAVVTITLANAPRDALEIRVHNHGAPIPKAAVPTLFEPYSRGEGAEQSARRGLGLGLYIVREIVRAHAGEIEVRSTESDGTTFIARLPRQPRVAAPQPMVSERAVPSEDGSGIIVRLIAVRPA
jgi:signal transduction histidine kinase